MGLVGSTSTYIGQTWGQALIIVLESSTRTFINLQVQVKVLSTYVKYFIPSTITSTSTFEIKTKKIK